MTHLHAAPAIPPSQPMDTAEAWPVTTLTAHEHIGFELGWDHAHHGVLPPAPYAQEPSPLRHGLLAGQAAFGARTLSATPAARRWLQLRLQAWLRGRGFELFQVTPRYLQAIEVSHCPVTRACLSASSQPDSEPSVDRLRNDGAYAAGNLAVMSIRANQAKGAVGFAQAMQHVRTLEDRPVLDIAGLGAAAWRRIALLCSFVEPMPHADACTLPLVVLPPPRVHLLNPVQALQASLSLQLARPGWAGRSRQIESLLSGAAQRRAYQAFFHALLPRVLEAVPPEVRLARSAAHRQQLRWAVEDAWLHPLVLRRWTHFARQLDAATCEQLLARMSALQLTPGQCHRLSEEQATEGWQLASRGYVPHALLMRRRPRAAGPLRLPASPQAALPL